MSLLILKNKDSYVKMARLEVLSQNTKDLQRKVARINH